MKHFKPIIVIILGFLVSCSDYRDISVFESLKDAEVLNKAKNDTAFLVVYDAINGIRNKVNSLPSTIKAKYYDITYSDLCYITNVMNNMSKAEHATYNKKWEKEFGDCEQKLDSISNKYKHYLDEIDIHTMVKITNDFKNKYGRYHHSYQELLNDVAPQILVKYWTITGYRYKEDAIRELVNQKYVNRFDYILHEKFPHEYEFMKLMDMK